MYAEKHIGEKLQGRVSKLRYTSPEEGFEDEIVVIVKNEEKGICAEIPLSEVLGRKTYDCSLSDQRCAVYDGRGNIVLSLCKPMDFIIEKADRKTMTILGRTNKELIKSADVKRSAYNHYGYRPHEYHTNEKQSHKKRYETKKDHNNSYEQENQ